MKTIKKTLVISSAFFIVFLCDFFAVNSYENDTVNSATRIEIWYVPYTAEEKSFPADYTLFSTVRNKFGIELVLTPLPLNHFERTQKLLDAAAGNYLPDIFCVSRELWLFLAEKGLLENVDDMYDKMPIRTSLMYDSQSRRYTEYEKGSFGLASPVSVVRNEGLFIRADWLKRLGLHIPQNIDDFFRVLKAFTFNDPDGNSKDDTWGYTAFLDFNSTECVLGPGFSPIFGAFGAEGIWDFSKKNPSLQIHGKNFYNALLFIRKMIEAGVLCPDFAADSKDQSSSLWVNGKSGVWKETALFFTSQSSMQRFYKVNKKAEIMMIDPPSGPEGQSSMGAYSQEYVIFGVSKINAEKEKIAQLLEWMSGDEGYFLLGWGQKNINYTLDKNGFPSESGLLDKQMGFSQDVCRYVIQLRALAFYGSAVELGSRFLPYKTGTGRTVKPELLLRTMQEKKWTYCAGAEIMPRPDPELAGFIEKSLREFLCGVRPLSELTWEQWLIEFDEAGGADWEEEGIRSAKMLRLVQ